MSFWFPNPDAIAATEQGVEWAPWVRYTRNPPVYDGKTTDEVAAYTPEERVLDAAVHEAGHAVLYMAAGHRVGGITVHEFGDYSHDGQAEVEYVPASGPWLPFALKDAGGERAVDRWLRETGLWTPGRAWVAERLAWRDRSQVHVIMRTCHNRELTFGQHWDRTDYTWITDRTDEALDKVWDQALTLADHVAKHRKITGEEAARIAGFTR